MKKQTIILLLGIACAMFIVASPKAHNSHSKSPEHLGTLSNDAALYADSVEHYYRMPDGKIKMIRTHKPQ